MFTPLMAVTLRPRPGPFEGPFISVFWSCVGWGGRRWGEEIAVQTTDVINGPRLPLPVLTIVFFHSPNPLMKCNKCSDAGGPILPHFSGFPGANCQRPRSSNHGGLLRLFLASGDRTTFAGPLSRLGEHVCVSRRPGQVWRRPRC